MRRFLCTTAALVFGGFVVLASPTASAATAERQVFTDTVVGGQREAIDACSRTFTTVTADSNGVFYSYFSIDWCTDERVAVTAYETWDTFTVTDTSVRVVADLALLDPSTGEPTGETVFVDNTWTQVGAATKTKETSVETLPGGGTYVVHVKGSVAQATITGTVPLDPLEYGTMGRSAIMVVTITP